MRQQEIENVQLRSELRTLARNEDLSRIEASVYERVQTMVSRSPPSPPKLNVNVICCRLAKRLSTTATLLRRWWSRTAQ